VAALRDVHRSGMEVEEAGAVPAQKAGLLQVPVWAWQEGCSVAEGQTRRKDLGGQVPAASYRRSIFHLDSPLYDSKILELTLGCISV
jgi:hypothetical protein